MTATLTPIEQVAAPAILDRFHAAAFEQDAPLDAVIAYARELGKANLPALVPDHADMDPARSWAIAAGHLQGVIGALARRLADTYSPHVRSAPPSALNDVAYDVTDACPGPGCYERLAPWERDYDGDFCSPDCEIAVAREDRES